MISSCYLQENKLNLILGMASGSAGLVFAQMGPKRAIRKSFSNFFS